MIHSGEATPSNNNPPPQRQALLKQGAITVGQPIALNTINPYELEVLDRFQQCIWDAQQEAKRILTEAQQQAETLENNARNRALELIEAAHQKAAAIEDAALAKVEELEATTKEQGFQAGFEEGVASGYETAGQETLALLTSAKQITALAYKTQDRVLRELKQEALLLMEHVLKQTGYEAWQQAPTAFMANQWETALTALNITGKVTVVLHPHHLELLQNFHPTIEAALADCSRFQFQTDAQLPLDACYLLSTEGCFDVSFAAQVGSAIQTLATEAPTPECLIVESETAVLEAIAPEVDATN
jgi:flagellar assembly protein FliH